VPNTGLTGVDHTLAELARRLLIGTGVAVFDVRYSHAFTSAPLESKPLPSAYRTTWADERNTAPLHPVAGSNAFEYSWSLGLNPEPALFTYSTLALPLVDNATFGLNELLLV
jgi:hypothetical protein